jgi:hypothetical protein
VRRRLGRFGFVILASLAISVELLGQSLVISGSVRSASSREPILSAVIQLQNVSAVRTDTLGHFRITVPAAGSYELDVRAIGFRRASLMIRVRRDTNLAILLQPSVNTLDTMRVVGRSVNVKGVIIDGETTLPVLHAQVTIFPAGNVVGAQSGRFSLAVPAREEATLVVEGLAYLRANITISADHDTAVVVALKRDSAALRLIDAQIKRLRERSQAMPYRIDVLGRDDIKRFAQPLIGNVILRRLPVRAVSSRWPYFSGNCIFFDDKRVTFDVLLGIASEVVERVEVFGQDAKMIRVYSRPYVFDLQQQDALPRIMFMSNGLHQVCA